MVTGTLLNVGVPHFVSLTEDPSMVPLESIGLWIRSHEKFGSEGANVNFVSRDTDHNGCYTIRTFERGVEAETLSCGTGAAAAALVLSAEGVESPVSIQARGGVLKVYFSREGDTVKDIWLEGPVRVIYRGVLADI
jgi:diaminopimelate epimerase